MIEQTQIVERFVAPEEEGFYLRVPFQVPEGVERIRISYTYRKNENIIDIGLCSPEGKVIGWAGSNRDELAVSEAVASPGFTPSPPAAGQWQILLGAYHVAKKGCTVQYHIVFEKKELRIFKGDTHTHTNGSDGVFTPKELTQIADRMCLDYLFLTDHNNEAQNETPYSTDTLTVLPGTEWTHYRGHAGMLGIRHPLRDIIANSGEEVREILQIAQERGALVCLNHPFCPFCGWKFGFDLPYDLVEVWNGGIGAEANLKCLHWWDEELRKGKRIPVIGGSDFHRLEPGRIPAFPCTNVIAPSKAPSDLIQAIRKGHSFITAEVEGPEMVIDGHQVLPGMEVAPFRKIQVEFSGTTPGMEALLIGSGVRESVPCAAGVTRMETEMPDHGYLRFELREKGEEQKDRMPLLISNPLYVEESDLL